MKSKPSLRFLAEGTAIAMLLSPSAVHAVALTWDGGGADNNWSTDANWVGDPVADPATGDTLTFAGTTRLTANNDLTGLILGNTSGATAFTFASGAGSFTIQGNALTVGTTTANTVLADIISSSNQTISNDITFAGNQRDRNLRFSSGAGSLTLSGNVNFSNSIIGLGITTSSGVAGTLTLSGTNTGDGKGAQITSGGNQLRAMLWTPQDGSRLIVGSDAALGNASFGNAESGNNVLRGIVSSRLLYLSTAGGDRNLSNYAVGITGGRLEFDGADNLSLGSVINSGGNRDLWVTGDGKLTVTTGVFLSNNDTGRNLFFNVTGSGGAEVTGKIYDTFSNTGGTFATMLNQGILRKAGDGLLRLSGDSSFTSTVQVEGGTLRIGHANALGSSDAASFTSIRAGTVDLNGFSTAEKFWSDNAAATLANSSATAAAVTTDIGLSNNLTVNTTGNITAERLVAGAIRTVTKLGAGTFTTQGAGTNNLTAWDIQAGTVVFANTSGLASDRGTTLNGGTLRLSGSNSNLINDGQAFTINSGTFDLNGKDETVASIGGSGGTITNTNATAVTLYVGGGVTGTSSANYGGVIQDGIGTLSLTKEGIGTQTLTGTHNYTGNTTVSNGSLVINGNISTSALTIVQNGAMLGGNGTTGALTILDGGTLAPGTSPGTLVTGSLTLNDTSILAFELNPEDLTTGLGINDLVSVIGNLTLDGRLNVVSTSGDFLSATLGDSWRLFEYSGSLTDQNLSLESMPALGSGLSWGITTATSGQVNLVIVPEPAAGFLGGIGLLALLRRRRN